MQIQHLSMIQESSQCHKEAPLGRGVPLLQVWVGVQKEARITCKACLFCAKFRVMCFGCSLPASLDIKPLLCCSPSSQSGAPTRERQLQHCESLDAGTDQKALFQQGSCIACEFSEFRTGKTSRDGEITTS